MAGRYQVLDELDETTASALRDDIAKRGVLVPIEVDEDGNVLDGHHRKRCADELGLDCPEIVRAGLTEEQKVEHALLMNLLRRHLGPVEWAHAFRRLAEARGIRLGTQGRQGGKTDSVAVFAAELGVAPRTARRRLRLADRLAGHPDLAARVDRGDLDATRAETLARERAFEQRRADADPPPVTRLGDGIDIFHGPFQEVLSHVGDESVDLVLTDPPWQWDVETLDLWGDLGAFCARVLKPGRALVAYSGSGCLKAAIDRLSLHLNYFWAGALILPGRHNEVKAVMARDSSTPIVFFSKGRYEPRHWFINSLSSPGAEKEAHPWQKPLGNVAYYLERFSEAGELVCDPFLGGGTTAVAAQGKGRRFIGSDVDPGAIEVTLQRLEGSKEGPRTLLSREQREEGP
ncbi:MAG: DNA methyltransferase [Acidimicrobiales bacterium]|jgi:ParB-like chromosome segregation protein Spo0J